MAGLPSLQRVDEATLIRWAGAVAKVLACNNIDKSQVDRLLEVANAARESVFEALESFVLYQAGRNTWKSRDAARLMVEALEWLRDRGAGEVELRRALGYVKWLYTAYNAVKKRRVCPQPSSWRGTRFEKLLETYDARKEFLSVASAL